MGKKNERVYGGSCAFFQNSSFAFFFFNVPADFLTRYIALDIHSNCRTCHFVILTPPPPSTFVLRWEGRKGAGGDGGGERNE